MSSHQFLAVATVGLVVLGCCDATGGVNYGCSRDGCSSSCPREPALNGRCCQIRSNGDPNFMLLEQEVKN